MKFLKEPRTKDKHPTVPWEQRNYTALYRGVPASEIPNTAVAEARNVLLFGERFRGRPGVKQWSTADLPNIFGRDGNTRLTKSGDVVTLALPGQPQYGVDFTADDVGNFIVWADGVNEQIVEFIDSSNVRVDSDAPNSAPYQSEASVRGKVNGWFRFTKDKLVFLHIGDKVYYSSYLLSTWNSTANLSAILPADERSVFDDYKGGVYLFTSNGHFVINKQSDYYTLACINTLCPDNDISSTGNSLYADEETGKFAFGRRYLYSYLRLYDPDSNNVGVLDRTNGVIQKETGTNNFPASRNYLDWSAQYKATDVVPYTKGENPLVTGIYVNVGTKTLNDWKDVAEGSFELDIDSNVRQVVCDFSSTSSWAEIANEIQREMRFTFPENADMNCSFDDVTRRFYFQPGSKDYTISPFDFGSGTVGVDIDTSEYLNFGSATSVDSYGGFALNGGDFQGYDSHFDLIPSGFMPSSDNTAFTHIAIYSTLTLSDVQYPGRNTEQYIWQKDIPLIKVFRCNVNGSGSTTVIDITSASANYYTFENEDIFNKIMIETGEEFVLNQIDSSIKATIQNTIYAGSEGNIAVSIGANNRCMCTLSSGGTLSWLSGDTFLGISPGDSIYLSNGHVVKAFIVYEYSVVLDQSITYQNEAGLAAAWESIGRTYYDDIEDQILVDRAKPFPLRQRLWQPLPNANLGQIVPGFLTVAQEDDITFYYSQLSDNYEYLVGHHNQEFQFNSVKDGIKALREFPSLLIIYCADSIWRTQINNVEFVEEPRIGEVVAIMSGLGLVDGKIGLLDKGGIHRMGNGIDILITSEPGIRMFDGRQFSQDMSIDENGRSYIKDDLQKLQSAFSMAYEPNMLGMIFWGSDKAYSAEMSKIFLPDITWRRAIEREHGFGFSELYGDDWVIPEIGIGSLQLYTDEGDAMTVILDARTGKPFALAVRKGHTGGFAERLFTDKNGSEIPWSIKYKEHTGGDERYLIRHMETHNFFRPEEETNKGESGYDANGFRTNQQIDVNIYVDGSVTKAVDSVDIPNNNDVVFSEPVEGRRLQLEVEGTASEIQGVTHKTLYDLIQDGSSPNNKISRESYVENQLSEPILWVTRGKHFPKNIANGSMPTFLNADTTTGPDGLSGSAMDTDSSGLTYTLQDMSSYTIMFGAEGQYFESSFIIRDNLSIRFLNDTIEISDVLNTFSFAFLESERANWHLFQFTRTATAMELRIDGVLIGSQGTANQPVITGDLQIGMGIQLYDVRIFSPAINADEVSEFYTRDVTTNQGYALLPINQ